ncbi:MAG: helix-turn-helix domain-containing protein [Lachnospiraceae bacterium]|nr:helix-turn-helix domain-containing protein [Lachnospiraceae bacterium]
MNTNIEIPIELLHYLPVRSGSTIRFPFYTFLYVTHGSVDIDRGNEFYTYRKNDLLLLGPDRPADLRAKEEAEIMLLGLTPSFLEDHLNMTLFTACDSTLHPDQDYLPLKKQLSLTADLYAKKDDGLSYTLLGSCYLILGELQRLLGDSRAPEAAESKYMNRVRAIADYIDKHYTEPLTLPDLAREFYLTPQYLSAFFRENFHTTFKNYLNDQRLFYSLRDLRSSHMSISEIAIVNGFSSFSAYRKNFTRKYGITPSEFRSAYIKEQKFPHLSENSASQSSYKDSGDSISESISIHTSDPGEQFKRKDRILNIGSILNLQSQDFRQRLSEIFRDFSFTYVRIMGMVSTSFLPAMLPDYSVNFQNLDTSLYFLHDRNMIPFIELTRHQFNFMLQDKENFRPNFIQRSERWFHLLEIFLAHISSMWPQNWLRKWRFEMWMTPSDSAQRYADDFLRVQKLIQKYIPGAAVGGPGYLHCLTPQSLDEILSVMQKKNITPGFISAYLTSYDYFTEDENKKPSRCRISPDPDYPVRSARRLHECAKGHYHDTPFYITEWTSVYYPELPIAYSRFQAVFLLKTLKEITPWCDLSGYWLFSDMKKYLPSFGSASPYILGQGLLTADFRPTAAYYAYFLIKDLGEELYASGKNYLACRKGPGHYQVLSYHYQHFLSQNAAELADASSENGIYEIFRKSPSLNMQIELSDLEPGIYKVQRARINWRNGCPYDVLEGEFRHSNLPLSEFLEKARDMSGHSTANQELSLPEYRTVYLRSDGKLRLTSYLSPHDVIFWNIIRQV